MRRAVLIGLLCRTRNHASYGPRQVHRRWTRRLEASGVVREQVARSDRVALASMFQRSHQSDRRPNADGGSSADSQGTDGVDDVIERMNIVHLLARGQRSLIEVSQRPAIGRPVHGRERKHGGNLARFRASCRVLQLTDVPPAPHNASGLSANRKTQIFRICEHQSEVRA